MPGDPLDRRAIWIADDSASDRERARAALAGNHELTLFEDGSAVLEALSTRRPPDALLLDWEMPGVTGVEVCRFVRESLKLDSVGVVLLTVHREPAQVAEALGAGANDFVGKPWIDAELRARVKAVLRQRVLLERAERAEASVRRLLSLAPEALFVVDAQGLVTYANEQGAVMLGRSLPEITGIRLEEAIPGLVLDSLSLGGDTGLLPLPDVTIRDRVYAPSVRILPAGGPARTTVSLRDVTDDRSAEARRHDFYSIVAHDMRSPLTAMLLRVQSVLRGRRGVLSGELAADLRKIEEQIRGLVAMMNDFLDLARLEGGGYKIDREPVDVGRLVQRTVEEFWPLLAASKLEYRSSAPEEAAWVEGDPRRLVQVLTNLLGNAIKFTPPGGTVTSRIRVGAQYVELAIEDNGPGIDPKKIPTLFQRYARALDKDHAVSGTGLGLMIVREIVEAHGGRVGVDSVPGKGSTFWLRLPRAAPPRAG